MVDINEVAANNQNFPFGLQVLAAHIIKILEVNTKQKKPISFSKLFTIFATLFTYLEPKILEKTNIDRALENHRLSLQDGTFRGSFYSLMVQLFNDIDEKEPNQIEEDDLRQKISEQMNAENTLDNINRKNAFRAFFSGNDENEVNEKITNARNAVNNGNTLGENYELYIMSILLQRTIVYINLLGKNPVVFKAPDENYEVIYIRCNGHGEFSQYTVQVDHLNDANTIFTRISRLTFNDLKDEMSKRELVYKTSFTVGNDVLSFVPNLNGDVFQIFEPLAQNNNRTNLPGSYIFIPTPTNNNKNNLVIKINGAYYKLKLGKIPLEVIKLPDIAFNDGIVYKPGENFQDFLEIVSDSAYAELNGYLFDHRYKSSFGDIVSRVLTCNGCLFLPSLFVKPVNASRFGSYPSNPNEELILNELHRTANYLNVTPDRSDIPWMIKHVLSKGKDPWDPTTSEAVKKEVQLAKLKNVIRKKEKRDRLYFLIFNACAICMGVILSLAGGTGIFIKEMAFKTDDNNNSTAEATEAQLKTLKHKDNFNSSWSYGSTALALFISAMLTGILLCIKTNQITRKAALSQAKNMGANERLFFKVRLDEKAEGFVGNPSELSSITVVQPPSFTASNSANTTT